MFADENPRPEGLHYQRDFISAKEEAALIGHIRALPLAPFQFGIYEGKRRVVFFGSRYDFTHQRLEASQANRENVATRFCLCDTQEILYGR